MPDCFRDIPVIREIVSDINLDCFNQTDHQLYFPCRSRQFESRKWLVAPRPDVVSWTECWTKHSSGHHRNSGPTNGTAKSAIGTSPKNTGTIISTLMSIAIVSKPNWNINGRLGTVLTAIILILISGSRSENRSLLYSLQSPLSVLLSIQILWNKTFEYYLWNTV